VAEALEIDGISRSDAPWGERFRLRIACEVKAAALEEPSLKAARYFRAISARPRRVAVQPLRRVQRNGCFAQHAAKEGTRARPWSKSCIMSLLRRISPAPATRPRFLFALRPNQTIADSPDYFSKSYSRFRQFYCQLAATL